MQELNAEYSAQELADAIELTNTIFENVKKAKETLINESIKEKMQEGISLEKVSESWQKIA